MLIDFSATSWREELGGRGMLNVAQITFLSRWRSLQEGGDGVAEGGHQPPLHRVQSARFLDQLTCAQLF